LRDDLISEARRGVEPPPFCPKGQYRTNARSGVLAAGWITSQGFSMNIHQWLAAVAETPFTRQSNPSTDLVKQAERLALAHMDEPLHISALCRTLEISERTLRKAFHRIHGLPPCRHLRMLRLSQARRALLSADRKAVTVTEIATGFGFVELGRFSVEYRKQFGESPSQTLQHALPEGIFKVTGTVQDSLPFGV
jgi:transcriptional regulator GlxA family with amidase domain